MTLMRDLQLRTPVPRLLKEERKRAGLKQSELADRLGVPQSFVSKYEIGERKLEFVEVQAICAALHLTLTEFAARIEAIKGEHDAAVTGVSEEG